MSTEVIVVGRDDTGAVAVSDGMAYYLTPCCGASAKGGEYGIVCRACYSDIDPQLGAALLLPGETPDAGIVASLGPNFYTRVTFTEVYGDGIPYDQWKAARAWSST